MLRGQNRRRQKLFLHPPKLEDSIAFVMSPRLGDSLLAMIVVNNLVQTGYAVTVFSDHLSALHAYFPWATIFSRRIATKEKLQSFDIVLYSFQADIVLGTQDWPSTHILEQSPYNWQQKTMVDIQVDLCRYEFKLKDVTRENHLIVKNSLVPKKYSKRIVIHPTSSELQKNWLPARFVELANQLKQRGFEPAFIVGPGERKDWLWLLKEGHILPEFSSLEATADWIYESGYFIGNDSGIGHLASNLGLPTVTLGMRPKMLQRWRPAWAPGIVLLPPKWLFARPLKQRFWKYFISTQKVLNAFEAFQKM